MQAWQILPYIYKQKQCILKILLINYITPNPEGPISTGATAVNVELMNSKTNS